MPTETIDRPFTSLDPHQVFTAIQERLDEQKRLQEQQEAAALAHLFKERTVFLYETLDVFFNVATGGTTKAMYPRDEHINTTQIYKCGECPCIEIGGFWFVARPGYGDERGYLFVMAGLKCSKCEELWFATDYPVGSQKYLAGDATINGAYTNLLEMKERGKCIECWTGRRGRVNERA